MHFFRPLQKHEQSLKKIQLKLMEVLRSQDWTQFLTDRRIDDSQTDGRMGKNNMSPDPEGGGGGGGDIILVVG